MLHIKTSKSLKKDFPVKALKTMGKDLQSLPIKAFKSIKNDFTPYKKDIENHEKDSRL
jgi:hypothetical protein